MSVDSKDIGEVYVKLSSKELIANAVFDEFLGLWKVPAGAGETGDTIKSIEPKRVKFTSDPKCAVGKVYHREKSTDLKL